MAKFIALDEHARADPGGLRRPARARPGRRSGCRAEDDGYRDDPLLAQNLISCTHYEHDFERAARGLDPRSSSASAPSPRARWPTAAGWAVAERLGTEPVTFPSHHGGFLGGEFGTTGDPDAFAATLREVLA